MLCFRSLCFVVCESHPHSVHNLHYPINPHPHPPLNQQKMNYMTRDIKTVEEGCQTPEMLIKHVSIKVHFILKKSAGWTRGGGGGRQRERILLKGSSSSPLSPSLSRLFRSLTTSSRLYRSSCCCCDVHECSLENLVVDASRKEKHLTLKPQSTFGLHFSNDTKYNI